MNTKLSSLAFVAALTLGGLSSAYAQQSAAPAAAATKEMSDGEIKKVDKDATKLTIRHGELKNLNMPPMTMVFAVKDMAMLDRVKVGDKVKFHVENDNGRNLVTDIEVAK